MNFMKFSHHEIFFLFDVSLPFKSMKTILSKRPIPASGAWPQPLEPIKVRGTGSFLLQSLAFHPQGLAECRGFKGRRV